MALKFLFVCCETLLTIEIQGEGSVQALRGSAIGFGSDNGNLEYRLFLTIQVVNIARRICLYAGGCDWRVQHQTFGWATSFSERCGLSK